MPWGSQSKPPERRWESYECTSPAKSNTCGHCLCIYKPGFGKHIPGAPLAEMTKAARGGEFGRISFLKRMEIERDDAAEAQKIKKETAVMRWNSALFLTSTTMTSEASRRAIQDGSAKKVGRKQTGPKPGQRTTSPSSKDKATTGKQTSDALVENWQAGPKQQMLPYKKCSKAARPSGAEQTSASSTKRTSEVRDKQPAEMTTPKGKEGNKRKGHEEESEESPCMADLILRRIEEKIVRKKEVQLRRACALKKELRGQQQRECHLHTGHGWIQVLDLMN